jgi:hypothetical protein
MHETSHKRTSLLLAAVVAFAQEERDGAVQSDVYKNVTVCKWR